MSNQAPINPCSGCAKREDCLWEPHYCIRECERLHEWWDAVGGSKLVKAVRADKVVGHGSCSSIDECWDDGELADELAKAGVSDPQAAVKWAREHEGLFLDKACDARWGEDDDPQLAWKRDFEKNCEDNPLED